MMVIHNNIYKYYYYDVIRNNGIHDIWNILISKYV